MPKTTEDKLLPDITPGSLWVHRNGNHYTVICITNKPDEPRYPKTVVYIGSNGQLWSRPASDWHRSMKLHFSETF
jgi:hypothetical protein